MDAHPRCPGEFHRRRVDRADAALRAEPEVAAALAARGITDLDLVFMDTWTYGEALIPDKYQGRRIGWSDTWVRSAPGKNPYAGPVNGFHCVIDLNTMELLEIEDTFTVDKPEIMGEYVPRFVPDRIREASTREELKPLEITQSQGPSFTLTGNRLDWQNWSLRVGFNHREGAIFTLDQLRRQRHPALHRAPALVRRDDGALPRPLRIKPILG